MVFDKPSLCIDLHGGRYLENQVHQQLANVHLAYIDACLLCQSLLFMFAQAHTVAAIYIDIGCTYR